MVLGNLVYSRVWVCGTCSKCGGGLFGLIFSHLFCNLKKKVGKIDVAAVLIRVAE